MTRGTWRARLLGALALVAAALPSQAPAADVRFVLDTGSDVLDFTLPQTSAPPPIHTGDYFAFTNLEALLNGAPATIDVVQFWTTEFSSRGGFNAHLSTSQSFYAYGPQLYTGTPQSPTFLTGAFETGGGSLAVTMVNTSVPEPAAWALMLVGFAAVGHALRRRRAGPLAVAG